MSRTLLAFLALMTLPLTAAAAEYVPAGSRTAVAVSAETRERVLDEMRGYVQGLAGITGALARGDAKAAADLAEPHGMAAMEQFPRANMMELPEAFRGLGRAVHMQFDRFAAEAQGGANTSELLAILSGALARCSGCHAAYRLETRE